MKILIAQINPTVGDLKGNTSKIISAILRGREQHATIVLFSELVLTGYSPQDFMLHSEFIDKIEICLQEIIAHTEGIIAIIGTPRRNPEKQGKPLYNSAAICQNGQLVGYQDKMLLPTYDVFDEQRYFEPAKHAQLWKIRGKRVGITICEDIWCYRSNLHYTDYHTDPILELKEQQPDFVINLSASPFSIYKSNFRYLTCKRTATTLKCPVILCNQIGGNDSLIYDGQSLVVGADGALLYYSKGFEEDFVLIDMDSLPKSKIYHEKPLELLHKALVLGVRDYFWKNGFKQACLGLSGGIDSALVACLAVEALGKENVVGISMPSRYSSEGSLVDAASLAINLGIKHLNIPIDSTFQSYLDMLAPVFKNESRDLTEQNLQARVRGMTLMAYSNQYGSIVLNTGNKSEMAVGYCTLYGDMCGGLSVIGDLTKRQVYALAQWINRHQEIIPVSTLKKPPSAELRPNQLDRDTLPEYDILDNIVERYVEHFDSAKEIAERYKYPIDFVEEIIKKIHQNEYKRRQSPPALRISEKAFSVGRSFPIAQGFIREK